MISVVMATYNGERFIREQLLSIFNQTMSVDEIIICDDNSRDNTVQIIKDIQKEYKNIDIRLIQNDNNLGYKLNFKKALSFCDADFIFLCDQDDIWLENKVEVMMKIMNVNKNIKVLASTYDLINENDNPIHIDINPRFSNKNMYKCKVKPNTLVRVPFERLIVENSFQGCALCICKEVIEKFQRCFSVDFHHDWLINLLASEQNGMYFLNVPLFHYRIHSKNTIGLKGNVTLKGMDHLVSTNTVDARTNTAKNCIQTLNELEKLDNELSLNYPTYTNYREFFNKHILYIENGKVIQLIIQNFNSYYKYFKTTKGRLMDIIVTFKVFINK